MPNGSNDKNVDIKVDNVSKRYGERQVLNEISFALQRSGRMVLVGSSGSGKTTLLRMIAGLDLPDSGQVHLNGKLASTSSWVLEPHLRRVGFVFQTPALWPHMTVRENIRFGLGAMPKSQADQRVDELLEAAKIMSTGKRFPDQISGGEAKRVAILRSIAPRPPVLLMDEPFVNLDAEIKASLLDFVLHMIDRWSITLLYVTHDADEVSKVGGQVLRLGGERTQKGV